MHKHLTKLRLYVEVRPGETLEVQHRDHASVRIRLTYPCNFFGDVEVVRGKEWLMVTHLPDYGVRLEQLRRGWEDAAVEVLQRSEDGTKKDFFDV